jgi:hypothetical protein
MAKPGCKLIKNLGIDGLLANRGIPLANKESKELACAVEDEPKRCF